MILACPAISGRSSALAERHRRGTRDCGGRGRWEVTVSPGSRSAPNNAANPRELVACAEAAMMTAKSRGKSQIVVFDENTTERPEARRIRRRTSARSRISRCCRASRASSRGSTTRARSGTAIADELGSSSTTTTVACSSSRATSSSPSRSAATSPRAEPRRRRSTSSREVGRGHHRPGRGHGRAAPRRATRPIASTASRSRAPTDRGVAARRPAEVRARVTA